jgi:two-component system cell cycle sensor histidine kinase/response regulator CckA
VRSNAVLGKSALYNNWMGRAATILAVDDDRSILGLLDNTLGSAGYRVLTADSGWNAVEVFEKSPDPIHLLLTDVIMPDLTGPVLAERLRARQPDLQVLFISGFHDADLVQRFVTRKGFTLLPKPFTVPALLRVVEESLSSVQL